MPRWLLRGVVLAAAVCTAGAGPLAGLQGPPPISQGGVQGTSPIANEARQLTRLSVRDAVAVYARGDFSAAVLTVETQGLKVAPFTRALDAWIAEGDPAAKPRRRLIAAAFALDVNWAATRTNWNHWWGGGCSSNRTPPTEPERELLTSPSAQPLVGQWAVRQLPATGVPDGLERTLWLAAIGLAEDCLGWQFLQRGILPPARKRLPDEPRVRLAEVRSRTGLDVGLLRGGGSPSGRDILRKEALGSAAKGPIPGAIRVFEPLLADASIAGEVELRIGYLELRRNNWSAALTRFDAARSKATEPTLLAIADYFAGFVYEQLNRTDDAITAYKRALAITPTMRNLATRLSALLYLRNERTEAYAVLDVALNARPVPRDLMVVMERADARFVPEWLESIRKALK